MFHSGWLSRLTVGVFVNFFLWFEVSRSGRVPASLRPPLHRVGAPGAVGRAGGGGGGRLALVPRASRVRATRT